MKQGDSITVGGKTISTLIMEISIAELKYWRENPRVDSIIKQNYSNDKVNESVIENELWKLNSVKDLYQDIKSNGGLIDEILVKDNMVLEGNSRLCAYRFLLRQACEANDEAEKRKWSKIRARVIPSESSDEVIFTILGTWHIKGKAQWRTYEKASYFHRMRSEYNKSTKEIAAMVKQSEADVENMIKAYETMQTHGITETSEQEKFSAVFEIVKNREMKKIKEEDPSIYDKCITFVKEDKFDRAEQVRDLPKVIRDKKAKKSFFNEGDPFTDALDIAKSRHPEHGDSFYNQLKKVTKLLESADMERIEEIKKDTDKKFILQKLHRQVNSFCNKIGIKPDKKHGSKRSTMASL